MACIVLAVGLKAGGGMAADPGVSAASDARRTVYLAAFTNQPLPAAINPGTWVDSERWCVAHACLEAGERLAEANRYFSEVPWVSLWQGLVADTDIQVTDLLWTWLRFARTDRLSPAARAHLLDMFKTWSVPNPDRNRQADRRYEWPGEYTENHSLNILTAAYFIDVVLDRERALRRSLLQQFLFDRARWGWSEFNSPAYALVTAKALGMLAAAAPDKSVADGARMHLDLLALDFAGAALHTWRGLPHARGYGAEVSNAGNAMNAAAQFWFGADDEQAAAARAANPYLLHLVTGGYQPPALAARLVRDPVARGRYEYRRTATHGPARQRIPIVAWIAPSVTLASAQGSGSYYDGSYGVAGFASSPAAVIVARDGKQRTMLQVRNVLATFGTVAWHGPLRKVAAGALTIGGDGRAWAGQIDLPPDSHLLMVAETSDYADTNAFRGALQALNAACADGVVTWTMPDGARVRMVNRRVGEHWRLAGAWVNDQPLRLDGNMLFDSPYVRSTRDSALIEVADAATRLVYDFRDPAAPAIRTARGPLTPVPATVREGPLGLRFLYIPGGEFVMGSGPGEGRENERPQRWVRVDGFYISETEIAIRHYRQFLAQNSAVKPPPDWYWREWGATDTYPITWVSWDDAQAFCRWLSKQTGGHIRLPTEAEWEKAAKGYAHRTYPWGDEYDGSQAGTPNGQYAPAGEHPLDVSPFGVRGMAGNAWEWCSDWYASDAYANLPAVNPAGSKDGAARALRGCGWNFDPDTFRCSYRSALAPLERSVHIGFRVVWEP
jgi:formylglycine-generating enzyme required for sulfatase activity